MEISFGSVDEVMKKEGHVIFHLIQPCGQILTKVFHSCHNRSSLENIFFQCKSKFHEQWYVMKTASVVPNMALGIQSIVNDSTYQVCYNMNFILK